MNVEVTVCSVVPVPVARHIIGFDEASDLYGHITSSGPGLADQGDRQVLAAQ